MVQQPTWLDKSFLMKVLQGEDENQDIQVTKFSTRPAVAAGNNFTSSLYLVDVDYQAAGASTSNSVSLFVKEPATLGPVAKLGNETHMYDREPFLYSEVIPELSQIMKVDFAPKFFKSPIENMLILENLRVDGYEMCDRFKQLDYEHCKTVLILLAKFHAASVVYIKKHPGKVEPIAKELYFMEGGYMSEDMRARLMINFEKVKDILNKSEGCEDLVEFIDQKKKTMWEAVIGQFQPKTTGLNVLNHGDCWSTNIMYKHNQQGEVIDVKLIDYQLIKFNSPVLDLFFFTWTSANEEVRENRLQDLYSIYQKTLNQSLEALGCDERFTSEEMQSDLKSRADLGLLYITSILPLVLCEPDNIFDLEKLESFSEAADLLYVGKLIRAVLPKALRQYYNFMAVINT